MALTVQNIVDASSTDARSVLGNSGGDATILMGWVDRVHKDCLHNSLYSHLSQGIESVALTSGSGTVTLASNMRRILKAYNKTANRMLAPLVHQEAGDVLDAAKRQNHRLSYAVGSPEFYFKASQTFSVLPVPTSNCVVDVYYEQQAATVSALGTSLVIPEDGKDMLVAGVNYLASQYLKKEQEAQMWFSLYEKLKKGEVVL
jgi:hypothetical protein